MRIAIASGKGGTGKTLVATNLARLWADQGHTVTYVDADAEEPNGHLFLKPELRGKIRFTVPVPALNQRHCAGHGKCQEICAFNAILSANGDVLVFNELCHSCGACILACPDRALVKHEREIGTLFLGRADKAAFCSARLDVGEPRATPLIEAVVHLVDNAEGIVIVDAPPGTSCSAIAAARDADLLLLVTEPTPFGMHDLQLALELGRTLGLTMAVVINRAQLGDDQVRRFLNHEQIPILSEIPFDRAIAEAYAQAELVIDRCPAFSKTMTELGHKLLAV